MVSKSQRAKQKEQVGSSWEDTDKTATRTTKTREDTNRQDTDKDKNQTRKDNTRQDKTRQDKTKTDKTLVIKPAQGYRGYIEEGCGEKQKTPLGL
jgi:hypothetical protein